MSQDLYAFCQIKKESTAKIRTDNLLFYYLGWVSFVSFLGIYLVFCFHHLYCHFRNKDKSFIILYLVLCIHDSI